MHAVCRDAFRRFHIFTVPLSPTRASFLLGGRNKHMGYEAYQVRPTHPMRPPLKEYERPCWMSSHTSAITTLPCLNLRSFHAS